MALKEQLNPPSGYGRAAVQIGDEQYLWILVFLEVGILALLRTQFRRNHGG